MSNGSQLAKVETGTIARKEFGAEQLARGAETATTMMTAQAAEEVRARYVMAIQRPRNIDDSRVALLQECARPGFAMDATYAKPVGREKNEDTGEWEEKLAEGLSIRFAERAAQVWRNIHISRIIVVDDNEKRIARVTATDLEANLSESIDVIAEKTIERRKLKAGQAPVRQRLNSYGELVYILPATEDDIIKKIKAGESKAKRDCLLHFIPRDILDECFAKAKSVQAKVDAQDPAAAKNAIVDSFVRVGVKPSDLEAFLGHPLDTVSPAEVGKIRGIFAAIRDGELTWADVMATTVTPDDGKEDPRTKEVKAKIAAKIQAGAAAKKKAAPEQTDPATGEVTGSGGGREPGEDG